MSLSDIAMEGGKQSKENASFSEDGIILSDGEVHQVTVRGVGGKGKAPAYPSLMNGSHLEPSLCGVPQDHRCSGLQFDSTILKKNTHDFVLTFIARHPGKCHFGNRRD